MAVSVGIHYSWYPLWSRHTTWVYVTVYVSIRIHEYVECMYLVQVYMYMYMYNVYTYCCVCEYG